MARLIEQLLLCVAGREGAVGCLLSRNCPAQCLLVGRSISGESDQKSLQRGFRLLCDWRIDRVVGDNNNSQIGQCVVVKWRT